MTDIDTCNECLRMAGIRRWSDAQSEVPPQMEPAALMWVAGLFEGEGSLSRSNRRWQLALSMTDLDVIERLRVRVGAGFITTVSRGRRLPIFQWRLCARLPMISVVEQLLPHMGERRSLRMAEALADIRPPLLCTRHRVLSPPPDL